MLPLNEWTHIAFTYTSSANVVSLYVNGIDIQDRGVSYYRSNSGGALLLAGFTTWPGSLDEVRIWNVARTAEQIRSTMNTSLAGNESGLHAYWRLDDSTGTLAVDQTGNGFDGLMGTNSIGDTVQAVWIPSTIPLGYGTSMNDSNFTSGTARLPGVSFAAVDTFDNPVEVTGTEIFSSRICSLRHPPSSPIVIGSWMSLAHPGHTVSIWRSTYRPRSRIMEPLLCRRSISIHGVPRAIRAGLL